MSLIFYISDPRSGQFLDLSIISQWRNTEIRPIKKKTHMKCTIISVSCHHRPFLTIHMQFLIGDPSEGHLRSLGVTNGFLSISGEEIKGWEWSHCLYIVETHRFICNFTYLGHHVTLTWGKIWPFNVILLLRIFSQVRSAGSCSCNPGREHSGSL